MKRIYNTCSKDSAAVLGWPSEYGRGLGLLGYCLPFITVDLVLQLCWLMKEIISSSLYQFYHTYSNCISPLCTDNPICTCFLITAVEEKDTNLVCIYLQNASFYKYIIYMFSIKICEKLLHPFSSLLSS